MLMYTILIPRPFPVYKKSIRNANFGALNTYFQQVNWIDLYKLNNIDDKVNLFNHEK